MTTRKEHKYIPGKVAFNGTGPKNNEVGITWTLSNEGEFSMSGEVWEFNKSDILIGGQCLDTIAELFPKDTKVQRMVVIWKRWHLNHMNSGSPAQEQWFRDNPRAKRDYDAALAQLSAAGLNPDKGYLVNGKPYSYGSAWLKEELPPEVIAEIKSWSAPE